jgi:hypothetical protein
MDPVPAAVIDVTNPLSPYRVAQLSTGERDATIHGGRIYFASGGRGIRAINLSDLHLAPNLVPDQVLPWRFQVDTVALSDTLAVIDAGSDGVHVLDAGQPSMQDPLYSMPIDAVDVAATRRYALALGDGLYIADMLDAGGPAMSHVAAATGEKVVASGHLAVVSNEDLGLSIVDLQVQPPQVIGTYASSSVISGLALDYYHLIAASGGELLSFDLANPAEPVVESRLALPGGQEVREISLAEGFAYIAGASGDLIVIDLSSPDQAVLSVQESPAVNNVAASETVLCASSGSRLLLYDSSSRDLDLQLSGSYQTYPLEVVDIAAAHNRLLVSLGDAGFELYNTSDCAFNTSITWSPQTPAVHEKVRFCDGSSGPVSAWHLDFGDGTTSDEPCPTHRFSATGSYQVSLTVSNDSLSVTVTETVEVVPRPALGEPSRATFEYIVPSAAHAEGVDDTVWLSDLELHNPGNEEVQADLYFLAAAQNNRGVQPVPIFVPAGRSLVLADVVSTTFGENDAAGAILVAAERSLLIGSRSYTSTGTGTFGQRIPVVPTMSGTGPIQLLHLSENAEHRSNLGLVNLGNTYLTIDVEVFAGSGALLGGRTYTLPPYGYLHKSSIIRKLTAAEIDDAFAVISATAGETRYIAFASVINNITHDPMFIAASTDSDTVLVIPVAVRAAGSNGTDWYTDLVLFNPGEEAVEAGIDLISGGSCDTDTFTTVLVNPGTSLRSTDVLGQLLATSGQGTLRITVEDGGLAATSRTYNDTGNGIFGQQVAAVPLWAGFVSWQAVRLIQLAHSTDASRGFRTNIGLVNFAEADLDVEIELYRKDGSRLGKRRLHLGPCQQRQVNNIFQQLTDEDLDGAFAEITTSTADAWFFAYASVIDNISTDAYYVPAAEAGQLKMDSIPQSGGATTKAGAGSR